MKIAFFTGAFVAYYQAVKAIDAKINDPGTPGGPNSPSAAQSFNTMAQTVKVRAYEGLYKYDPALIAARESARITGIKGPGKLVSDKMLKRIRAEQERQRQMVKDLVEKSKGGK